MNSMMMIKHTKTALIVDSSLVRADVAIVVIWTRDDQAERMAGGTAVRKNQRERDFCHGFASIGSGWSAVVMTKQSSSTTPFANGKKRVFSSESGSEMGDDAADEEKDAVLDELDELGVDE